jgi:hypothetical protein
MERSDDNVEGHPIIADSTVQPHSVSHSSCSDALVEVGVQNLRHERISHPFVVRFIRRAKFMSMRQKMGGALIWAGEWHLRPIYLILLSATSEFKFSPPFPPHTFHLCSPCPLSVRFGLANVFIALRYNRRMGDHAQLDFWTPERLPY